MRDADKIFETAFDGGELEVRNLKDKLSGAELREFDGLLALKSDLKKLGDVPECQLTTDHLRRAVLNRRPVAARSRFNLWTVAPIVSAAGLAFVMFFRANTLDTKGVVSEVLPSKSTSQPTVTPSVRNGATDGGVQDNTPTSDEVAVNTVTEPSSGSHRRQVARRAQSTRVETVIDAANVVARNVSGTFSTAELGSDKTQPESIADSALGNGPSGDAVQAEFQHEPVVVVSDHANPKTGAAEAQEVSRPSDVLFGG